jgi:hypothetical protein
LRSRRASFGAAAVRDPSRQNASSYADEPDRSRSRRASFGAAVRGPSRPDRGAGAPGVAVVSVVQPSSVLFPFRLRERS